MTKLRFYDKKELFVAHLQVDNIEACKILVILIVIKL